ncbi:MAG: type II toxin-antitoxin system RelE/ParE family toxin [Phycisphaerae bacterium]
MEFASVTQVLKSHGVSDDSVRAMQRDILQGRGDLVKGTGGLRKIRCAAQGRGKSGGVRVLFADYPGGGVCLLVAAFAKNVKENLTPGQLKELAALKARLDALMLERFSGKGRDDAKS